MLKQFIEQLSSDMGFEQALDANEDGSYSLRLEPAIDIHLQESSDATIMLQTKVAKLPSRKTEEFLLKAMIANLFGRETGGAALGLDKEGKEILLLDFLLEEKNYRVFHERLEDFVNYADAWRQETIGFSEQQDEVEE
jgi:Tir chaperone protein (CesT) family